MELRRFGSPASARLARTQRDAAEERVACSSCGAHLYVTPAHPRPCSNCGGTVLRALAPGAARRAG